MGRQEGTRLFPGRGIMPQQLSRKGREQAPASGGHEKGSFPAGFRLAHCRRQGDLYRFRLLILDTCLARNLPSPNPKPKTGLDKEQCGGLPATGRLLKRSRTLLSIDKQGPSKGSPLFFSSLCLLFGGPNVLDKKHISCFLGKNIFQKRTLFIFT